MRVNFDNAQTGVTISKLNIGDAFLAKRTSRPNEMGLYMKIDKNSGLIRPRNWKAYAVNLETGQLREFAENVLVEKVSNAEVVFKR